jgi:hypothetical protein
MCKSTRGDLERLMGGKDAKGGKKEKAYAEVTESAEDAEKSEEKLKVEGAGNAKITERR